MVNASPLEASRTGESYLPNPALIATLYERDTTMDSHSIAARPSATTEKNATNLSEDRRCTYAATVSIRTGQPSEAEGKTILPGAETCCDGQPPRIATSRRLLLAGFAALPLAACPAPVPARPADVCAKLAELIDVARDAMTDHDDYRTTVYDPCEEREVLAHMTGGPACPIPTDVARRHDDLLDAVTHTENQVMDFPSTTIADLHAKIVFMVDRGLFGVLNPSATLLADAARLAGVEA